MDLYQSLFRKIIFFKLIIILGYLKVEKVGQEYLMNNNSDRLQ